ncbi:MAG: ParB N-terminal domain-containing protein [Verrucomicrobia bacterium]|nr:ParB N-terminal domain-containing protein [Verrucomicrobiota bacterium]
MNCAFDELVPLESWSRTHATRTSTRRPQVTLLAKVIAHQGWRSPIVVSRRSGFVVSGHGRYEAAKVLGLAAVPVDFQDFATDADEWAHLVADNRLAELAEVDDAALRGVLGELKAADFDMDLAGFDANALAGLLADPPEPTPPEDFTAVDENLPTEFQCPKCSYRWSGKPS